MLFSEVTFAEFESRLWRPTFDRYLSIELCKLLLHDLRALAQWVDAAALGAISATRNSRDADDDKFVHLAIAGAADVIVGGDQEFLLLYPGNGLPVLSPADALRAFALVSL